MATSRTSRFIPEFKSPNNYNTNRNGAYRYIFSHVRKYWVFFGVAMILQVVGSTLQSIITSFIGTIGGGIINSTLTISTLTLNSTLIASLALIFGAILLIRSLFIELVAQRIERNSRDELYSSILGKSLTFHDNKQIGDLMARITTDVRQLNFVINPGFQLVFQAALGIIIPFIFIAFISPQLLIVPVCFAIVFFLSLRQYNAKLGPQAWMQRSAVSMINSRLNECISGMTQVRSNSQEEYEREFFLRSIQKYKDISVQIGKIQGRYYPLLFLGLATTLSFAHGLFLVNTGSISFEQLISFLLLIQLLRFPTFINIFALTILSLGVAASNRIIELIEEVNFIDSNPEGYSSKIRGEIVFNDVTFGYNPAKPVIKNLSISVAPNQIVALVGITGSGKTTVGKLLSRLYDPQEGEIIVDGVNLKDWSIKGLRKQMALVEQDIFLYSRSIYENIKLGNPEANKEAIIESAKLARIHEFITSLPDGYETEIGERGVQLSGGQRQRVAIARAVLRNPKILILDDATSAIDSKTEDEIQNAISGVLKGRVSFLITHRIAQIQKADLIIVLDKGRVIAKGDHQELVETSPKYKQIFSSLAWEDEVV